MKKSKYTWQLQAKSELPSSFTELLKTKNISTLMGQLLWQRNIRDEAALRKFLEPNVADLYDPFLMHDMQKAIERIQTAVEQGESILIYGDYDADGITSTTVMKEGIELIGGEVDFFLPNRFIHGYGPNLEVFKEKIAAGVQVIITVDNGVAGHEAVAYAMEQGVDVIITDHHELPAELPNAYAIVHPKHPEGNYPFGDLAGVGVAFKVVTALLDELPMELLDLVALGTIADLVSLTDENRILVQMGLQLIQTGERIGLDTLIREAGLNKESISEESIGFALAPRLNALGRLGEVAPGVELLTTFDEAQAQTIAKSVNQQNDERKKIVATITEEAMEMINPADSIHVLAKKGWHEGVLGIVAGRIMQETGKPTIVLTINEANQSAKGSGRSIPALNLYEALAEIRELFQHFGGHHMAAGLTLGLDQLTALKEHLQRYIEQHAIDVSQGQVLTIDETLEVAAATLPFIEQLKLLAPFGTDNSLPTFAFEPVTIEQARRIGADNTHLKFQLKQNQAQLDAIAFQFGHLAEVVTQGNIKVAGQLAINEWNGNKKPQLMVSDFMVLGIQLFDFRGKKHQSKELPVQQTVYIIFNEQSKKYVPHSEALVFNWTNQEELLQLIQDRSIEQLVFVDCPVVAETLREIVQATQVDRNYFMLVSEEEAYLNGIGSREQFAHLYKFIRQHQQLDVRHKLKQMAHYLQIPEKLLIFMIQVFFDLGFVTIDNGVLKSVDQPKNQPLTSSSVYQKRLKKIKTEEFLLYSDWQLVQQWLRHEEDK